MPLIIELHTIDCIFQNIQYILICFGYLFTWPCYCMQLLRLMIPTGAPENRHLTIQQFSTKKNKVDLQKEMDDPWRPVKWSKAFSPAFVSSTKRSLQYSTKALTPRSKVEHGLYHSYMNKHETTEQKPTHLNMHLAPNCPPTKHAASTNLTIELNIYILLYIILWYIMIPYIAAIDANTSTEPETNRTCLFYWLTASYSIHASAFKTSVFHIQTPPVTCHNLGFMDALHGLFGQWHQWRRRRLRFGSSFVENVVVVLLQDSGWKKKTWPSQFAIILILNHQTNIKFVGLQRKEGLFSYQI